MKIIIPGGSGQVGTVLARAFHERGDDVVVLSRKQTNAQPWRVVSWDGATRGEWISEMENADVVINLAGQSVNCRYTPENRRIIIDSRINSTRIVGQAIAEANNPPRVWLQASTATIYAHRFDAPNDERTGIIGGREPGGPSERRFSLDGRSGRVGARVRRGAHRRHAEGRASRGDDVEPGSRRRLRPARLARTARPWRQRRQ